MFHLLVTSHWLNEGTLVNSSNRAGWLWRGKQSAEHLKAEVFEVLREVRSADPQTDPECTDPIVDGSRFRTMAWSTMLTTLGFWHTSFLSNKKMSNSGARCARSNVADFKLVFVDKGCFLQGHVVHEFAYNLCTLEAVFFPTSRSLYLNDVFLRRKPCRVHFDFPHVTAARCETPSHHWFAPPRGSPIAPDGTGEFGCFKGWLVLEIDHTFGAEQSQTASSKAFSANASSNW